MSRRRVVVTFDCIKSLNKTESDKDVNKYFSFVVYVGHITWNSDYVNSVFVLGVPM